MKFILAATFAASAAKGALVVGRASFGFTRVLPAVRL